MNELIFDAADESDTDRFGAALAAALPDTATIALCGTLGAGKTRLVQAIAAACGIPREDVVSPTFVLIQQYYGNRTINHLDAYRVRNVDEFLALGIDELYETAGVTIIEWADRVPASLPEEYLQIEIEVVGPTSRRFHVRARGQKHQQVIERVSRTLRPTS